MNSPGPAATPPPHGAGASGAGPGAGGVSAVVVSWNCEVFLDACLTSLFAQTGGFPLEVVVVDNGSTDGSIPLVRERHPRATLVELGENRGFCAANNAGLAVAGGEHVLFANADLVLESDFVAAALGAFARDERIGLVGGKLLRFDRRTVDSAGQFMTRSRRVVERDYGLPDGPRTRAAGYVFSICGAALVCRRDMIEDISVGGEFFDESYFAFSEDLDIGWRARLAGWRAWYEPSAVAYHYRGGSERGGTVHPRRQDPDPARRGPAAERGVSLHAAAERRAPALVRRSSALRFHILKNRWLTLIKNDDVRSILRDLPFILMRDLAMLGATLVLSPRILVRLLGSGRLVRGALGRRREFLAREGRWGRRRAGARRAWVDWTEPRPAEPEVGS
jgi:GT2 family glycosyltransferase